MKIDPQGTGFFTATTAATTAAPATGVPFNWLVLAPQPGDVWIDGVELTQGVSMGRPLPGPRRSRPSPRKRTVRCGCTWPASPTPLDL